MDKLIAVGMRYQKTEGVREALKDAENKEYIELSLLIEENSNGVDGLAVGVWYHYNRVAYIRNKDLSELIFLMKSGTISPVWRTTQKLICSNYWVLKPLYYKYTQLNSSYETTSEQLNTQKETKMNISSNMRDSFFREVKNIALDIQTGKFGVVSGEGLAVYTNGEVLVNPITEFGIKIPAFAMRTSIKDLKEGDIVVNGNDFSFFKGAKVTEDGYTVMSLNGEVKQVGNVSNLFFGKNSILAVKNMFGDSTTGMNPLMLAMMLGDGKEFDMKTFALMSMMGGGGAAPGGMDTNMMMMMMMLSK